ncbi:MAG: SPOR domain-containing protein [Bacteroidales bacterium]|nr:SPOR domain-containing protein [Bacteroidales bacterium]
MKKIVALIFTAALMLGLGSINASAQNAEEAQVDSTLIGKDIFKIMPSTGEATVTVHQSKEVERAFNTAVKEKGKTINGYRVRIYFDNKQGAREASQAAMASFKAKYPGIAAYKTFSSPFHKVTVGNFRTKSEALKLLNAIKYEFPSSFIVKEKIDYPAVSN